MHFRPLLNDQIFFVEFHFVKGFLIMQIVYYRL